MRRLTQGITGRGGPQEDWRIQVPRMLSQDQPRCSRSLRVCHARRTPDQEEEEGQVPDLVKWQALNSDEQYSTVVLHYTRI